MEKIVNKHKAPKDILLNKILKEVDEENGVVVEIQKDKIKKKPRKKPSWLKRFFYFSLFILGISIFLVIYFINHAIEDEDLKTLQVQPMQKQTKAVPKETIKEPMIRVQDLAIISTSATTPIVKMKNKYIEPKKVKIQEVINVIESLSEEEKEIIKRKQAKSKLLEEMNN